MRRIGNFTRKRVDAGREVVATSGGNDGLGGGYRRVGTCAHALCTYPRGHKCPPYRFTKIRYLLLPDDLKYLKNSEFGSTTITSFGLLNVAR
jgi:hypothetical protein